MNTAMMKTRCFYANETKIVFFYFITSATLNFLGNMLPTLLSSKFDTPESEYDLQNGRTAKFFNILPSYEMNIKGPFFQSN